MSISKVRTTFPGSLRADLHLHSLESDGRFRPSELVSRAVESGLELVALTDHDTLSGLEEARETARELGCYFVNGVEVEATLQNSEGEYFGIHILGYGIDPDDPDLQAVLQRIRDHRVERARMIHERLLDEDVELSFDRVLAKSEGQSLSRVHIAQALRDQEAVDSIDEAFERFLANGKPAYVPKSGPGPEELIAYIHGAGGVAVWAHPYYTGRDEYIGRLVEAGIDGIEAMHSDFSPDSERRYHEMAERHGLFVTGGSDYHGTLEENFTLGDWWLDVDGLPFPVSVNPNGSSD
jgi:predicted metal-dependent phosphoesterase TrpH